MQPTRLQSSSEISRSAVEPKPSPRAMINCVSTSQAVSSRMSERLNVLSSRRAAMTFGDIARDGHSGPPELIYQSELLGLRKRSRKTIDRKRQLNRALPDFELPEGFSHDSTLSLRVAPSFRSLVVPYSRRLAGPIARSQVFVDGAGGFAAGAHGEDDGSGAGDDIAAGKDAALGRTHGLGIGNDVVALVGGKVGRGALDERIGSGADADDGDVGGQNELRAGNCNGTAAAAGIGLAQFHAACIARR